jgi:hypothetical protein
VTDVLPSAQAYLKFGWMVIPVPAGRKKPAIEEWQKLRLTEADLPKHFANGNNVGVLNGEPSRRLTDVDLDVPEAVAAAVDLLPPTQLVHGRPSNPFSHHWYQVTGTCKNEKFQFVGSDKRTTVLVELRSTGTQTLVPPSMHPDGEQYRWERRKSVPRVDPALLRRQVARVASCALLARHWPGQGSRDDAAMALCGMLLRGGWSVEDTDHVVQLVARIAGDDEWRNRGKAERTARKIDAKAQVTGAPMLATLVRDGEAVVRQVRIWLGLKDKPYELNEKDEKRSEDSPLNSSNSFNSYALPPYPAPLAQVAYHGVIGELAQAIAPDTEADPIAILVQLLVAFGNAAGRHAHVLAEADRHFTNLFACIVGPTAGGRKGTSWGHVRKLMQQVDADWLAERVVGGLSSGEGLIHSLRDGDDSVTDKRLLAYQPEFAAVLKVLLRDGNLLSDMLKQAWDGTPLQVLTKQNPERASNTLVSIIGHITPEEAQRYLTTTEAASGFGNRFIWICARRAQFLPEGGNVNMERLAPLVEQLCAALKFAETMDAIARDDEARRLWIAEYRRLSEGRPGLLGAMTARAEAQVMRLALLYALLDKARAIGEAHLRAALALWDYALASARYIFGAALGDPVADAILHALRATPGGMTRTDISNLFGRNKSAGDLDRALSRLQSLNLVRRESESTEGRTAERWYAVTNETKSTNKEGATDDHAA